MDIEKTLELMQAYMMNEIANISFGSENEPVHGMNVADFRTGGLSFYTERTEDDQIVGAFYELSVAEVVQLRDFLNDWLDK